MPLLTTFASDALNPFGFTRGAAGASYWMAHLTKSANLYSNGIAIDSAGKVTMAGYNQSGSGGADAIFQQIKADATGIEWQKTTTSGEYEIVSDLAADGDGSVAALNYNTGYASVAKMSGSGAITWERRLYNSGNLLTINAIKANSSGEVFAAGTYWGVYSVRNQFIVKWNSSGTIQWQRSWYTGSNSYGYAVAADTSGNSYFGGNLNNGSGAMITKMNSSGTMIWSKYATLGGGTDYVQSMTTDVSDNLYAVVDSPAAGQTLILKYNSSGTHQWTRALNSRFVAGSGYGGVTVDGTGNVYLTGSNGADAYIIKYNSSGTIQWQRKINASSQPYLSRIQVTDSGMLAAVGYTPVSGYNAVFVVNVKPDGSGTGSYVLNGITYTYAASSLTDSSGSALGAWTPSIDPSSMSESAGTRILSNDSLTLAKVAI